MDADSDLQRPACVDALHGRSAERVLGKFCNINRYDSEGKILSGYPTWRRQASRLFLLISNTYQLIISSKSIRTMANPQSQESSTRSWFDDWPDNFDGTGLYDKITARTGLGFRFDVDHLIRLIGEKIGFTVVDIPKVYTGSNYFVSHSLLACRCYNHS